MPAPSRPDLVQISIDKPEEEPEPVYEERSSATSGADEDRSNKSSFEQTSFDQGYSYERGSPILSRTAVLEEEPKLTQEELDHISAIQRMENLDQTHTVRRSVTTINYSNQMIAPSIRSFSGDSTDSFSNVFSRSVEIEPHENHRRSSVNVVYTDHSLRRTQSCQDESEDDTFLHQDNTALADGAVAVAEDMFRMVDRLLSVDEQKRICKSLSDVAHQEAERSEPRCFSVSCVNEKWHRRLNAFEQCEQHSYTDSTSLLSNIDLLCRINFFAIRVTGTIAEEAGRDLRIFIRQQQNPRARYFLGSQTTHSIDSTASSEQPEELRVVGPEEPAFKVEPLREEVPTFGLFSFLTPRRRSTVIDRPKSALAFIGQGQPADQPRKASLRKASEDKGDIISLLRRSSGADNRDSVAGSPLPDNALIGLSEEEKTHIMNVLKQSQKNVSPNISRRSSSAALAEMEDLPAHERERIQSLIDRAGQSTPFVIGRKPIVLPQLSVASDEEFSNSMRSIDDAIRAATNVEKRRQEEEQQPLSMSVPVMRAVQIVDAVQPSTKQIEEERNEPPTASQQKSIFGFGGKSSPFGGLSTFLSKTGETIKAATAEVAEVLQDKPVVVPGLTDEELEHIRRVTEAAGVALPDLQAHETPVETAADAYAAFQNVPQPAPSKPTVDERRDARDDLDVYQQTMSDLTAEELEHIRKMEAAAAELDSQMMMQSKEPELTEEELAHIRRMEEAAAQFDRQMPFIPAASQQQALTAEELEHIRKMEAAAAEFDKQMPQSEEEITETIPFEREGSSDYDDNDDTGEDVEDELTAEEMEHIRQMQQAAAQFEQEAQAHQEQPLTTDEPEHIRRTEAAATGDFRLPPELSAEEMEHMRRMEAAAAEFDSQMSAHKAPLPLALTEEELAHIRRMEEAAAMFDSQMPQQTPVQPALTAEELEHIRRIEEAAGMDMTFPSQPQLTHEELEHIRRMEAAAAEFDQQMVPLTNKEMEHMRRMQQAADDFDRGYPVADEEIPFERTVSSDYDEEEVEQEEQEEQEDEQYMDELEHEYFSEEPETTSRDVSSRVLSGELVDGGVAVGECEEVSSRPLSPAALDDHMRDEWQGDGGGSSRRGSRRSSTRSVGELAKDERAAEWYGDALKELRHSIDLEARDNEDGVWSPASEEGEEEVEVGEDMLDFPGELDLQSHATPSVDDSHFANPTLYDNATGIRGAGSMLWSDAAAAAVEGEGGASIDRGGEAAVARGVAAAGGSGVGAAAPPRMFGTKSKGFGFGGLSKFAGDAIGKAKQASEQIQAAAAAAVADISEPPPTQPPQTTRDARVPAGRVPAGMEGLSEEERRQIMSVMAAAGEEALPLIQPQPTPQPTTAPPGMEGLSEAERRQIMAVMQAAGESAMPAMPPPSTSRAPQDSVPPGLEGLSAAERDQIMRVMASAEASVPSPMPARSPQPPVMPPQDLLPPGLDDLSEEERQKILSVMACAAVDAEMASPMPPTGMRPTHAKPHPLEPVLGPEMDGLSQEERDKIMAVMACAAMDEQMGVQPVQQQQPPTVQPSVTPVQQSVHCQQQPSTAQPVAQPVQDEPPKDDDGFYIEYPDEYGEELYEEYEEPSEQTQPVQPPFQRGVSLSKSSENLPHNVELSPNRRQSHAGPLASGPMQPPSYGYESTSQFEHGHDMQSVQQSFGQQPVQPPFQQPTPFAQQPPQPTQQPFPQPPTSTFDSEPPPPFAHPDAPSLPMPDLDLSHLSETEREQIMSVMRVAQGEPVDSMAEQRKERERQEQARREEEQREQERRREQARREEEQREDMRREHERKMEHERVVQWNRRAEQERIRMEEERKREEDRTMQEQRQRQDAERSRVEEERRVEEEKRNMELQRQREEDRRRTEEERRRREEEERTRALQRAEEEKAQREQNEKRRAQEEWEREERQREQSRREKEERERVAYYSDDAVEEETRPSRHTSVASDGSPSRESGYATAATSHTTSYEHGFRTDEKDDVPMYPPEPSKSWLEEYTFDGAQEDRYKISAEEGSSMVDGVEENVDKRWANVDDSWSVNRPRMWTTVFEADESELAAEGPSGQTPASAAIPRTQSSSVVSSSAPFTATGPYRDRFRGDRGDQSPTDAVDMDEVYDAVSGLPFSSHSEMREMSFDSAVAPRAQPQPTNAWTPMGLPDTDFVMPATAPPDVQLPSRLHKAHHAKQPPSITITQHPAEERDSEEEEEGSDGDDEYPDTVIAAPTEPSRSYDEVEREREQQEQFGKDVLAQILAFGESADDEFDVRWAKEEREKKEEARKAEEKRQKEEEEEKRRRNPFLQSPDEEEVCIDMEEVDYNQAARYYQNQMIGHRPGPVYTIQEDEAEERQTSSDSRYHAREHTRRTTTPLAHLTYTLGATAPKKAPVSPATTASAVSTAIPTATTAPLATWSPAPSAASTTTTWSPYGPPLPAAPPAVHSTTAPVAPTSQPQPPSITSTSQEIAALLASVYTSEGSKPNMLFYDTTAFSTAAASTATSTRTTSSIVLASSLPTTSTAGAGGVESAPSPQPSPSFLVRAHVPLPSLPAATSTATSTTTTATTTVEDEGTPKLKRSPAMLLPQESDVLASIYAVDEPAATTSVGTSTVGTATTSKPAANLTLSSTTTIAPSTSTARQPIVISPHSFGDLSFTYNWLKEVTQDDSLPHADMGRRKLPSLPHSLSGSSSLPRVQPPPAVSTAPPAAATHSQHTHSLPRRPLSSASFDAPDSRDLSRPGSACSVYSNISRATAGDSVILPGAAFPKKTALRQPVGHNISKARLSQTNKLPNTLARVLLKKELKEAMQKRRETLEACEIEANQRQYVVHKMLITGLLPEAREDDIPAVIPCLLPVDLVSGARVIPRSTSTIGTQKNDSAETRLFRDSREAGNLFQDSRFKDASTSKDTWSRDWRAQRADYSTLHTRQSVGLQHNEATQTAPQPAERHLHYSTLPSTSLRQQMRDYGEKRSEATQTEATVAETRFDPVRPASRSLYDTRPYETRSESRLYESRPARDDLIESTRRYFEEYDRQLRDVGRRRSPGRAQFAFHDDEDDGIRENRRTQLLDELARRREKMWSLTDLPSETLPYRADAGLCSDYASTVPHYGSLPRIDHVGRPRQRQQRDYSLAYQYGSLPRSFERTLADPIQIEHEQSFGARPARSMLELDGYRHRWMDEERRRGYGDSAGALMGTTAAPSGQGDMISQYASYLSSQLGSMREPEMMMSSAPRMPQPMQLIDDDFHRSTLGPTTLANQGHIQAYPSTYGGYQGRMQPQTYDPLLQAGQYSNYQTMHMQQQPISQQFSQQVPMQSYSTLQQQQPMSSYQSTLPQQPLSTYSQAYAQPMSQSAYGGVGQSSLLDRPVGLAQSSLGLGSSYTQPQLGSTYPYNPPSGGYQPASVYSRSETNYGARPPGYSLDYGNIERNRQATSNRYSYPTSYAQPTQSYGLAMQQQPLQSTLGHSYPSLQQQTRQPPPSSYATRQARSRSSGYIDDPLSRVYATAGRRAERRTAPVEYRSLGRLDRERRQDTRQSVHEITSHVSPSVTGARIKRILLTRKYKDQNIFNDLGIKVVGGKRMPGGELGAFVAAVNQHRYNQTLGEIKEGDQVLEWNGVLLSDRTFEEVERIINAAHGEVEIILKSASEQDHRISDLSKYSTMDRGDRLYDTLPERSVRRSELSPDRAPPVPTHRSRTQQQSRLDTARTQDGCGHIQIAARFDQHTSRLTVHVLSARGLRAREGDRQNRLPNPFCKIYLLPGRKVSHKRRTRFAPATVDPEWMQVVEYDVPCSALSSHFLELSVWDYDKFAEENSLGQVTVSLADSSLLLGAPRWFPLEEADPRSSVVHHSTDRRDRANANYAPYGNYHYNQTSLDIGYPAIN